MKKSIAMFEYKLKDWWGFTFPEWAGCRLIQDQSAKVKGGGIDVESDCIIYDERCREGVFGISHEADKTLLKISLTRPKKLGIDTKETPIRRAVSTFSLLERYFWIGDIFVDNIYIQEASVLNYNDWESNADIDESFSAEINALQEDPCLAMYWLLHMGLTLDTRYDVVKEKVLAYNLAEKLPDLVGCMAFFEQRDVFYNLEVYRDNFLQKAKFYAKSLFLIRRANLLWMQYSYSFAGGERSFEKWRLSVVLYPKADEYRLRRVYWLKNNLEKFDAWMLLRKKLMEEHDNICLLSYVMACNPNTENKVRHGNQFLNELNRYKDFWPGESNYAFARVMLWDLRGNFTKVSLFEKVVGFYFKGKENTREYKALCQAQIGQHGDAEPVREDSFNLQQTDEIQNQLSPLFCRI